MKFLRKALSVDRGRVIRQAIIIATAVLASLALAITATRQTPRGGSDGALVPVQSLAVWEGAQAGALANSLATAKFVLTNGGGVPVRIHRLENGCGCASSQVDRTVVEPGESATVSVSASVTPLVQRDISTTVVTDSITRPAVTLTLRVVGSKKPPFLFRVSSIPSLIDERSLAEGLEFTVETVEPVGERGAPKPTSSHNFVRFAEAGETVEFHKDRAIMRKRRYLMSFSQPVPAGTSVGTVTITDPWDPVNSRTINMIVRRASDLTASPSVVRLRGRANEEVAIIVRTKEVADRLSAVVEGPNGTDILVRQNRVGGTRKFHQLRLSIKGPRPTAAPCEARLRISAPFAKDPLVIPVHLGAYE
jgi:hypothetical protein